MQYSATDSYCPPNMEPKTLFSLLVYLSGKVDVPLLGQFHQKLNLAFLMVPDDYDF